MNSLSVRRGTLIEVQRRSGQVLDTQGVEYQCAYSPQIELRNFSNFAVGDEIEFFPGDGSQEPLITAILPRKSKISRPGPGERFAHELILAANVDLLVVVAARTQPDFNPRMLDRYLAIAAHYDVEAMICINKSDLDPELPKEVHYLESIGYSVVSCSASTGFGMPALKEKLSGRLAVLSGASGAGKTSLIQHLFPDAIVRVGEVRQRDGKGRHTTTSGRLYVSADGIRLIDTPGLRALGFWNVKPAEIAGMWLDFKPYVGKCKFTDCMHRSEPECAILQAVEQHKIPTFRLESYYRILETLDQPEEKS